jgi:hypothetical protein
VASRYFRRRWDESRGDDHDSWGCADYLFETNEDLVPLRQIEVYDGGQRLLFDAEHSEDAHGRLAWTALSDWDDSPEPFEITRAEFELEWSRGRHT